MCVINKGGEVDSHFFTVFIIFLYFGGVPSLCCVVGLRRDGHRGIDGPTTRFPVNDAVGVKLSSVFSFNGVDKGANGEYSGTGKGSGN